MTLIKPGLTRHRAIHGHLGQLSELLQRSAGLRHERACARPPMQFSEPGPPCVTITPNFLRLFIRLYPSAAMIAPRSCLNMIGRMPSWATASMRLLDGKHEIHSTPSVFKIRATAGGVFILIPP